MKTAVIGGGKMGSAIARAVGNCVVIDKDDDYSNLSADVIIFAVKPQIFGEVLPRYKGRAGLYVSIAAGVTISKIKGLLGEEAHIVRAMPNLPASIGAGTTAVCRDALTTDEEFEAAKAILGKCGAVVEVDERDMDTVVALSGSSPAYGFMMLEAMADFGVSKGLTYRASLELAANSLKGAMELALSSEQTPKELTEMVCSPKGTTIEAVGYFNERDFQGTVKAAMERCRDRSAALGA